MPARRSTRARRASQPARLQKSQSTPKRRGSQRYTANASSVCLDKRAQRAWAAAGMACNVALMTDFPYKPDEVVHIKGFASGMWDKGTRFLGTGISTTVSDFDQKENLSVNQQTAHAQEAQRTIFKLLNEKKHKVLVWDGDALADDSYTKFIEIRARTNEDWILAPFVKKEDLADRIKSWKKSPVFDRMTFYVTPNFANWKALGVAALFTTGSRNVICLGGGETVQSELQTIRIIDPDTSWGKGVTFHSFPFRRYVAKKDQGEVTALVIENGRLMDKTLQGTQLEHH